MVGFGNTQMGKGSLLATADACCACGLFALCSLTFTMLLGSAAVILSMAVVPACLIVGCGLSALLVVVAFRNRPHVMWGVVACSICLVACVLLCAASGFVHDMSWDGNMYQKVAVHEIANGWNPLYESSLGRPLVTDGIAIFIDHYPHGLYYVQSCIYALTHVMETAKCTTLILAFAVACMLFWYLRLKGLHVWQAVAVSALAVVNPITVAQGLVFYVDAFLMMSLLALLLGLVVITDGSADRRARGVGLAVVACGVVLCVGTKFTGFVYAGAFCLSFAVLFAARCRTTGSMVPRMFAQSAIAVLCAFAVAVFFVGASSYCKNELENGNPFYPLAGERAVNIMRHTEPAEFADASIPEKLFRSYFSKCSNANAFRISEPSLDLKVPFTVALEEVNAIAANDLRVGGFGPLSGGILLLGVPLCAAALAWSRRNARHLFGTFAAYLVPTFVLTFSIQESWWARYSVYVYASVVFVLVFLALWSNRLTATGPRQAGAPLCHKVFQRVTGVAGALFALAVVTNTMMWLNFNTLPALKTSKAMESQVRQLERVFEHGGAIEIMHNTSWLDSRCGTLYTLDERGIAYSLVAYDEDETASTPALGFLHYRTESRQETDSE